MNCSRGCAWSKVPEAGDPQQIQREFIWDLGDVSPNQAVFCPLLSPTTTMGVPLHQDTLKVGQPTHPDASTDSRNSAYGFVLEKSTILSPLPHTNPGCKVNRERLLCCFNSPLQLKCKAWTVWLWVWRMWWELRESRRFHMTFPQWDDRSLICCWATSTAPVPNVAHVGCKPLPRKALKIMACSREEPDLLLHKRLSLNCRYP